MTGHVLLIINLIVLIATWSAWERARSRARYWRRRAEVLEFVILNRAITPPDPRGSDD